MEQDEVKTKRGLVFKGDIYIWITVLFLCSISLIEVFSASSRLTFGKSSFLTPIISPVIHLMIGLAVMYIVHLIHYRWYNFFPVIMVPSLGAATYCGS